MDKYRSLFNLDGKVALVAGGGGDIGKAISEGLASFGATVVVCGRTLDKAQAVADSIVEVGGKASSAKLDVLDIKGVGYCVDQVAAQHGHVDILVNCVGTQIEAPAEEYKEEDWDRIFAVNLKSAFFLSQSVAKHQISGGGGKHIHVTSVRSALGIRRGFIGYCASKGGMNMMVKQLASEWAKYNICVNGIAPTFTRTELVRPYLDDPQFYNPLVARIPMGRIAETLDLAGLAIYLAAPAANFTTGQIVYVDGGVTACQ
jgi:NAD(P)-dependent dehydrogenase (short-subunit alcohol dehydrogenase family)